MELLTANQARSYKKEVLQKVAVKNPDWMDDGLEYLSSLTHFMGTGEDLRLILRASIGEPSHSNAWGALVRAAVARGYLEPTGEHVPMRVKSSHGRMTPVYVAYAD
jgi:hypothetical protein